MHIKKLFMLLMIGMFMISLASAINILPKGDKTSWDIDNVKKVDIIKDQKYPNIRIENAFGLGGDVWTGKLEKNTDTCGSICEAEKVITIDRPTELVSDIRFRKLLNEEWEDRNIKSFKFYVNDSVKKITVNDYETTCSVEGDPSSCERAIVGNHTEDQIQWVEYNIGDVVGAGTYRIKLEGEKKWKDTIDWQIKTNGEWLDEWAVWGVPDLLDSLVSYYRMNESAGQMLDSRGLNNATTTFVQYGWEGLIDNSYGWLGADRVIVPYDSSFDFDASYNFSFSFWLRINSTGTVKQVMHRYTGAGSNWNSISISTSDEVLFYTGEWGATSRSAQTDPIPLLDWYYFTCVSNQSGNYVYVNGVLNASATSSTFNTSTNSDLYIARSYTLGNFINGSIDEFAIFNKSLVQSEITALYNSSAGLPYSSILDSALITLNSPDDNNLSSTLLNTFNATAETSGTTTITNMSLLTNETSWGIKNTTTGLSSDSETETWDRTFVEGLYLWGVQACASDGTCGFSENRTITVNVAPPIVNDAQNIFDLVACYHPINTTWNYTATDSNIDDCYYNTTEDASITIITCNASQTIGWTTAGNKTIQYCANDTFGLETCKEIWVNVTDATCTQSADLDPVGEGAEVTFDFNISIPSIPVTTATLWLNDTYYTVDTTSSTTDYYYFTRAVTIPDDLGNTTGFPQLWNWNFTVTGLTPNSSTNITNITVYEVAFDNCSTYGEEILNISLNDEEANTRINGSLGSNIEIDLLLTSTTNASLTWTYNNTWVNETNVSVCIPSNILNNTEYYVDMDMGFDSTNRVWEFYFLDNGTLNETKIFNAQTNTTINLMDLLTADSTSFLFNYFDVDGLPVDDIIVHVFRQYIGEGVFREVERAKADENGDTVIHLVEEDVIYYFLITQYGIPLYLSSEYTALCQATPCTIQLEAGGESAQFGTDWDLIFGGGYDISSDASTRVVTLNYSVNSSRVMNITLYEYDDNGNVSVVASNQSTGTNDVLTLTIPQVAGNISFFASVYEDGEFINSEWIDFESKPQDRFGIVLSLFLSALIILTLGLMAISEGVGTMVMVILGVAISGFMGLINTSLSSGINIVVYLIVAGGILTWKLTRRRS